MSKKFWKISIYSMDREYGGCEEGGWWYDCGDKVREVKKVFTDKMKAIYYAKRLDDFLYKKFGKNRDGYSLYRAKIFYRGTPNYFPSRRPYYC